MLAFSMQPNSVQSTTYANGLKLLSYAFSKPDFDADNKPFILR